MSYINFSFGSRNKPEKGEKLSDKIDNLLKEYDLGSYEFDDEILLHTIGFFISSPNMIREAKKDDYGNAWIQNFFFRLELDNFANNLLKDNTIVLKGDLLIKGIEAQNIVDVKDFYIVKKTEKLDYEVYFNGLTGFRDHTHERLCPNGFYPYVHEDGTVENKSADNLITLNLASHVPFVIDPASNAPFNKFTNDWYSYLEFEKTITLNNIKSFAITGKIDLQPVFEVADSAVNCELYENNIIRKGRGNLYVDCNSSNHCEDEMPYILLTLNVKGSEFGKDEDDIIKKARNFARMNLSILGSQQKQLLDATIEELRKSGDAKKNDLPNIEGFDLDGWLMPEYDKKSDMVTFFFLVNDESSYRKDADPESEIKELGEELYLAHIATGDIALYKRGKDALDKIKTGDVKNPYLAGYIVEPQRFEKETDSFNMDNVKFALKDLNLSQKEAIIKCLNSNSIFLLQGPPGTGKTQTITELVYQFNKMGKKVLMSSQTHIAIDNVIERLPKELNILPIRLVRDRSKVNAQYLPDRLLDNLYDAAYYKYKGKIEDYESYEKNIKKLFNEYEQNVSRYDNINERLKFVKKLEDDYNEKTKELSQLRAQENEMGFELDRVKCALEIFTEYAKTKLPFERVLDNYNYEPLLKPLKDLAKRYNIDEQDNFYNYAVAFKRRAGKDRIAHLNTMKEGGEKPKELIDIENEIIELEKEKEIVKKYNKDIPSDLINKVNDALREKKKIDEKFNSLGTKVINITKEKFFFVETNNGNSKEIIQKEIKVIADLVKEYETILSGLFSKTAYDELIDKRDLQDTKISDIERKIKGITVTLENIKRNISEQNTPIENERKKLDEYLVSFYTGKMNGVALPEKEENKLNEIKSYIDNEKRQFEEYKNEFDKLHDIFSSLTSYLEDRENFVKPQRLKYTETLLVHNANVYGITCTSSPFFHSSVLVDNKKNEDSDANKMISKNVNIRDIDFDVVIIDEVSKATPIEMLIPIIYGKTVVLVGDQRQLPPIFKYRKNMFEGKTPEEKAKMLQGKELNEYKKMVETSLFEEIYNKLEHNRAMLTQQYRFNEQIMKCVNVFYGGKLTLGAGAEQNNKKQHYLDVEITVYKDRKTPIFCQKNNTYWFDSHCWADGTVAYSRVEEGETSYRNPLEVKLTIELLKLLEKGYGELKEKNPEKYKMACGDGKCPRVAVLTMYGKHISSIKKEMKEIGMNWKNFKNIYVDISTVDNYQGKEQDIVIVNMVANTKNNPKGEFLRKFNRINVAISRARTMLIMIGSKEFYDKVTVNVPDIETGKDNPINAYYKIFEQCEGKYGSAARLFGINRETVKK
jgi:superfamily I DNA and/or RNA helicase